MSSKVLSNILIKVGLELGVGKESLINFYKRILENTLFSCVMYITLGGVVRN